MTMCEGDCQVCTDYIRTKEDIRAQAEESVRISKQAQMREAYENASENELNIECERCNLPKNVEWSFNAIYLCRDCSIELEEPCDDRTPCGQCAELCDPVCTLPDIGQLCMRCFHKYTGFISQDVKFCYACQDTAENAHGDFYFCDRCHTAFTAQDEKSCFACEEPAGNTYGDFYLCDKCHKSTCA